MAETFSLAGQMKIKENRMAGSNKMSNFLAYFPHLNAKKYQFKKMLSQNGQQTRLLIYKSAMGPQNYLAVTFVANPIFFPSLTKDFSLFAPKLGHFIINDFFLYVTNTQA